MTTAPRRLDRRHRHARHALASALSLAIAWIGLSSAHAATPAESSAPAGSEMEVEGAYDPFAAFGPAAFPDDEAGPAAPVYQDRIIDADDLQPLPVDAEEDVATGPRREWHVEAIAHRARYAGEDLFEVGVATGGFWESADWGTFSLDALLFRTDGDRDGDRWRGSATLWQRGLDMPGGWRVDNGLGVLNTPMPTLLRDQYRFLLPSVPMLGASTEWRQANGLTLQAAAGRGGLYSGARLSGFEPGDGAVATFGAEWRWNARWSSAATLLATDGRIVPDDRGLPAFQNGATRALLLGQRWQGVRDSATLQVQASDAGGEQAAGAWLDMRSVRGGYTHRYGVFRLEPELAWGAWPIANDVQGGYYRIDAQRARWSWNLGIDRIDSVSGDGFEGWYGTAFWRWQSSSRLAYGGGVTARRGGDDSDAETLQGFVDLRTFAGDTRFQFDLARVQVGDDSWRMQVDHALRLREGWRLSLSASHGALVGGGSESARTSSLAAYGGFDIGDNLAIDGTVRWTHATGDSAQRGFDVGLGWRWRIAPHWTLAGDLTGNHGSRRSPFALDPITNQRRFETLPDDRSLQVTLRYDIGGGRARQVIGGAPGAAVGQIAGSVFLDDNADGVRGAAELPATDVTVLVDGRYSVRTDAQGRFRFDRVAVGTHTLEIVPDNLPLPWSIDAALLRREVRVEVRDGNVIEIPAQRPR